MAAINYSFTVEGSADLWLDGTSVAEKAQYAKDAIFAQITKGAVTTLSADGGFEVKLKDTTGYLVFSQFTVSGS